MSEQAKPRLYSDFDGTAVKKYPPTNPRNWTKYPLPGLPGHADFISGAIEKGVDFAGFVSIRKAWVRRWVTERSLRKLGYNNRFSASGTHVVYAGSEAVKGAFVVNASREATVGMIDDKPHKLGAAMIEAMRTTEGRRCPIILGVVDHPDSGEYLERLFDIADAADMGNVWVHEEGTVATGFTLYAPSQTLEVVRLGAYSHNEGAAFAGKMLIRAERHAQSN